MAMNPDTNEMEVVSPALRDALDELQHNAERLGVAKAETLGLIRPDGTPVPEHWSTYTVDEEVIVKNYRWRVAHIGEKHLLLEPLGPVLVGDPQS